MMRSPFSSKRETCLQPVYPTRSCRCPHCDTGFEAARRAVTLKCPNCARPIQFQDVDFSRASAESLTTLGRVRILRRGSVSGSINCNELHVQGMMSGSATVRGAAIIGSRANVTGTLRAVALAVEPGGRLRGSLRIGPPEREGPAEL